MLSLSLSITLSITLYHSLLSPHQINMNISIVSDDPTPDSTGDTWTDRLPTINAVT